jgi:acyl-CoA hydrolase
VEVEFVAEAPLLGERRRCGHAVFNLVAGGGDLEKSGGRLPPLVPGTDAESEAGLHMVELVLPQQTSHYGSLYGGHALASMGKAAFVAATRHCRKPVVMASSLRVDFEGRIHKGEVMELAPRLTAVGKISMTVEVELFAENLLSGERRRCGQGAFVMVAVDARHRPVSASPPAP